MNETSSDFSDMRTRYSDIRLCMMECIKTVDLKHGVILMVQGRIRWPTPGVSLER